MGVEFQPSKEFTGFFFLAIEHGFWSIEESAGPLVPFVISLTSKGSKDLNRFVTERLEDGIVQAQKFVSDNQHAFLMYAIAWDGFVTMENERTEAILIEAADRTDDRAVLFCQRYRKVKKGIFRRMKSERIGNPVLIDRPISRFTGEINPSRSSS